MMLDMHVMRRMWLVLAGSLPMFVAAGPALAQEVDEAPPTALTQWVFIIVAVLLAGMVVSVSLMSSRRGHQD